MAEQRPASPPPEAQLAFARQLRELRRRTLTMPTEAALARRMRCARSTVSAILNGRRFPTWPRTAAFVEACGGVEKDWLELWLRAKRHIEEARRGAGVPATVPAPAAAPVPAPLLAPLPVPEGAGAGSAMLAAQWYRNNREFYGAAAERVREARSEIRVTYMRRYPPTQYTTPASAAYFEAVLGWAGEDSEDERCVRRIIGIPEHGGTPDGDMLDWARRHHEDSKGILNYEASVLRWPVAADGLNMALIDDSVVFLAFSGGPRQKLNGFIVEDPTFMSYFASYFEQLWAALQPLGAYLQELDGTS
ncbi:helix-turn-helix domain-containing protein [Streptomyces sp. NPDC008001]|uniref:helix-turn-helix domain-containing protein n=1 Tax=Streptomyces sp. NPDC008001 TaxID=3364804 RepID=UPI0036ECB6A9